MIVLLIFYMLFIFSKLMQKINNFALKVLKEISILREGGSNIEKF